MTLSPYDPEARCPKCGWPEASVTYSRVESGRFVSEEMHRACACCGYGWREAPLDAEEASE